MNLVVSVAPRRSQKKHVSSSKRADAGPVPGAPLLRVHEFFNGIGFLLRLEIYIRRPRGICNNSVFGSGQSTWDSLTRRVASERSRPQLVHVKTLFFATHNPARSVEGKPQQFD